MKEEIFTKFKKDSEENKKIPLDCFQTDNSSSMKIMGCVPSDTAQPSVVYQNSAKASRFYNETIVQAFTRLDTTITEIEKDSPSSRLAGLIPLIQNYQEVFASDIRRNEDTIMAREAEGIKDESIMQVIVDLKLSQNPQLVSEHEEFVANINRQAMNKLNQSLTEAKFNEMKDIKEKLEDEVGKLQLFYKEQDLLLEKVLGAQYGSAAERNLEAELSRIRALRDTLSVSARSWRAAAAAAVKAHTLSASALLSWQLISQTKKTDIAECVRLGIETRDALIKGAREIKAAQASLPDVPFPHCTARQLQALALTLDYMFTDMYSTERYQHATRVFSGFSDRTLQLAKWITDILKTSLDKELEEIDTNVNQIANNLRAIRVNLIDERGYSDVQYKIPQEILKG